MLELTPVKLQQAGSAIAPMAFRQKPHTMQRKVYIRGPAIYGTPITQLSPAQWTIQSRTAIGLFQPDKCWAQIRHQLKHAKHAVDASPPARKLKRIFQQNNRSRGHNSIPVLRIVHHGWIEARHIGAYQRFAPSRLQPFARKFFAFRQR